MTDGPVAAGTCMDFVGVSTGGSSARQVFPAWADALGLPTRTLVGHDVAVDAPAATYRGLVEKIRDDPAHHGALVTTHKMAMYAAAADLFDDLDELAQTFGEVSCIAKRDGRLQGSAKDPVSARLALEDFVPAGHFASGGAALVLGSGGAGVALSQQLGVRADRPERIICTALSAGPLEHAYAVHQRGGVPSGLVSYVVTPDAGAADALVATLPPTSLVVNATGMGKDRPGSPVSDRVVFPERGLVWEFNYRGALPFLDHARAQQDGRRLHIEDGWRYFVHGWSQAVAEVFALDLTPADVDELARIAGRFR